MYLKIVCVINVGGNMEYNLDRFIIAQKRDYEIALEEIKSGYKRKHWMWYIFPQISGLGFSPMAKKYEIVDLGEAKAYMNNSYLRNNLQDISRALLEYGNDDIEVISTLEEDKKDIDIKYDNKIKRISHKIERENRLPTLAEAPVYMEYLKNNNNRHKNS